MESAITSKGQATIPAAALRGIIKARRRPVTIEEMTNAVAAGAADIARRKRR